MYHWDQIEVSAAGQDKICVKFSIGYLAFYYLQSIKNQVVYVAVGCRIKLRTFLQIVSIEFIRRRSTISSSDLIPRRFISSLSLILRIRRSHLVILDIAQAHLLKRTLRSLRWPAVGAQDSQPHNKRFMTIAVKSRTRVTTLRD